MCRSTEFSSIFCSDAWSENLMENQRSLYSSRSFLRFRATEKIYKAFKNIIYAAKNNYKNFIFQVIYVINNHILKMQVFYRINIILSHLQQQMS